MLPHSSILSLPPSQKQRRRTLHFGPFNKKTRSSPDQIHVRELTIDQVGLGCAVWDGAQVLARYVYANAPQFVSKSVVELGAGIGLPALVAARYASRVYITDYIDELLQNVEYNVKLNSNIDEEYDPDEGPMDDKELERRKLIKINMKQAVKTKFIDWHKMEELPGIPVYMFDQEVKDDNEAAAAAEAKDCVSSHSDAAAESSRPYDPLGCGSESLDYVIGSEIMYTRSSQHRHSLTRTINFYLKPGGEFVCVQSANREGMELFIELMMGQYKYNVKVQKLTESSGLIGNYQLGVKQPKGFVQREEDYYLYQLTKPMERPTEASPVKIPVFELVPDMPRVQYALDEEKILESTVDAADPDKVKRMMEKLDMAEKA